MATNLTIKGKAQNGDSNTTTINYVNPAATNEQLMSLATAFNDFTTNTITDVTRIDKSSLTSDSRSSRNIRILDENDQPITSIPLASLGEGLNNAFGVILQGEGINYEADFWVKFTFPKNGSTSTSAPCVNIDVMDGEADFYVFKNGTDPLNASAMTVNFPATDLYQAVTVTLQII